MAAQTRQRTNVFISYSHQDSEWLQRLRVHLRPLERETRIEIWDDTRIKPGSKWKEEIEQALAATKVAVLLVSADFLASDFIAADELPPLLDAAEKDGAIILPVILSPSRFLRTTSLSQFQTVNDPSRPLIGMPPSEYEAILVEVTEAIEAALTDTSKVAGWKFQRSKVGRGTQGTARNTGRANLSKPPQHPDFVDSLIILFVSAAAVIFVFWIASQTLNLESFVKVPDFIRDSFKAIWTSVATGATGIGLAVYKALTRSREQAHPNYLLLVGITTGSILLLIFLLLFVLRSMGPHTRINPPPDTELLEIGSPDAVPHTLNLRTDLGASIYYEMKGRYTVKGRKVEGTVEQGSLSINKDLQLQFPMHFQSMSVSVCYIENVQGNEILNWFPNPMFPPWSSATRVDINAVPGSNQSLPAMNFKIDLPSELGAGKMWLCSALAHTGGGYFPGHQVTSNSR